MSIRFANYKGRASLLVENGVVDIARASADQFGPDPMQVLACWERFTDWAFERSDAEFAPLDETKLGPCVPRPGSVFAIGLNYREHAEEAGLDLPKAPLVFTKFPSCLAGPRSDVFLFSERVDWEVELVAVIGRRVERVPAEKTLDHIAGYCVGQDISDRALQFSGKPPQFSLGKSRATFGPIGPAMVSLDNLRDPNDLHLSCDISGERVQESRTSNMIFPIPELVSYLSHYCTLEPGDLIFSGTPSGVGSVRQPRRYLKLGDEIVSTIEGIGTLVNHCVAPPDGM